MRSISRVILLSLFMLATIAYAQDVVQVPASEQEQVSILCTWIQYNTVTGLVTVNMKDFITANATASATIDGTDLAELHEAVAPGKATMGQKVKFPNANPKAFTPGKFTVQLTSVALAKAIQDKKKIVVTVAPGNDMFDRTVRTIRYPSVDPACITPVK